MIRSNLRTALFFALGFVFVAFITSGVSFHREVPVKEYGIKVPGAVVERNLEKLVRDENDAAERKLFQLFPAAYDAQTISAALPLVEGFNNTKMGLPERVKPMWDNSLLILGNSDDGMGVGSGFVVRIKAVNGGYRGYILTNNHVVEDFCDFSGDCPELFVLHDIGINAETGDVFRTGSNIVRVKGARLLKASRVPDLALLEVNFDQAAVDFLKIAEVQNNNSGLVGQAVYAIGYPATYRRTSKDRKYIEDQSLIIKRWSYGSVEEVGYPKEYSDVGELVFHSADILPGNSGSGLYNNLGTAVGVNVLLFNVRKDFDYNGATGGCGMGTPTSRASVAPSMMVPFLDMANRQ